MHGDADRLVPFGNGELIAGRIRGAEFVKLPKASHIYPTDFPGLSEKAVISFLSKHRLQITILYARISLFKDVVLRFARVRGSCYKVSKLREAVFEASEWIGRPFVKSPADSND